MKKSGIILIMEDLAVIWGVASLSAFASMGYIVCEVAAIDIVTYINGHRIPAYSLNGETAVRVASLNDYGFDVLFQNGVSLANYNESKPITPATRAVGTIHKYYGAPCQDIRLSR